MLNDAYIFTDKGLISKSELTTSHSVLEEKEFSSLKSTSYSRQQNVQEFQDSNDDIIFILNAESICVVDDITATKKWKDRHSLQVDDWIFHPWIEKKKYSKISKLDLSKYTDNYKTLDSIYVFTDEILDIAKKFNISVHALKDIFTREAAEYNDIIPDIKKYVEEKYCKFEDLPTYIKDNCSFKMARYLHTENEDFILVMALLCQGLIDISEETYKLTFINLRKYSKYNQVLKYLKKLNVKYIDVGDDIVVLNKPLHQLFAKYLQFSLCGLKGMDDNLQQLFLSLMPKDLEVTSIPVRLMLQLKEFYYLHKIVSRITYEDIYTFSLVLEKDTVVVDVDGYYTQLISISPEMLRVRNDAYTYSGYITSSSYISRSKK